MEKLSTKQVSVLSGKSQRQIRNLCEAGKLPCFKEDISTGKKYLIYTNTKEFQELCGNNSMAEVIHLGEICEEEDGNEAGNFKGSAEIISELTSSIERLAREAGKAELLTDNLINRENDVKYWQEKYFEIQQELFNARKETEEARKETASLKNELIGKTEQLEKQKQKTFFGIKIK